MEKVEFIKLEDEIKQILIENPETREDDMYLYYVYCVKKDPKFYTYNNFVMLFSQKIYRNREQIRTFGAVERVRRKIQSANPELASEKTKKARAEKEEEFKEYSRL